MQHGIVPRKAPTITRCPTAYSVPTLQGTGRVISEDKEALQAYEYAKDERRRALSQAQKWRMLERWG